MAELSVEVPAALTARLARLGVGGLEPLTGGASSLTYHGVLDTRPVVVKVAPAGVTPVAHRDVLRQARLLKALQGSDVPVPHVVLEDPGDPPDIPPLFAMTLLDGECVEPLFDVHADLPSGGTVAARFRGAAAVLARLHRVDPAAVGLGDEPVLDPSDEVERWSRTLETVDQALVPGWPETRSLLQATLPAPARPAIVHGDFRLGNLLAVGPEITAVIDWEIWSLGDPRIDLGWFLINSDPQTYRRPVPDLPVPRTTDLIAVYRAESGGTVEDLEWFCALACFKSAATWSLIIKHNRRRHAPDPDLEAMGAALPRLLARAQKLIEAARRAGRDRPPR
ncbi:acyl-CoA dehydrogenase [Mycolicibacterium duvalii]|uniref:Aminoglycoside phosphotransferase n=1 Tax=Mycolicibacterium duvalii TaxID=39688 RepID=A0A7I7K6D4_9MYCO|nr:phosphotransferase family protein [Mycolicibacterium duvalii]MCV7369021.1 phosphotransferase family protein [Mycolicibacterium duvalii]PEG44493.1 acyl-CoA dehydrogenase [Mycolicibacterium duvalii]BBX19079.1 aminoglycoside phosphotransferase [Mycolicibacterium duvalii]